VYTSCVLIYIHAYPHTSDFTVYVRERERERERDRLAGNGLNRRREVDELGGLAITINSSIIVV
jgi:hypothetical protein